MLQEIFPTPIYMDEVSNRKKITAEINSAMEKIDFKYNESWGKTHRLSDPTFQDNLIQKYGLKHLKDAIALHVKNYMLGIFKLPPDYDGELQESYIYQSWIALFGKGDYGHIHNHGEADIAGVYYHKKPEGSGDLFFDCPTPGINESVLYSQHWAPRLSGQIPEGAILLFPGFLKHGISSNPLDVERVSISFNIIFDKVNLYPNSIKVK